MFRRDRELYATFVDSGYIRHAQAALVLIWAMRVGLLFVLFSTLSGHGF